MGGCVCKSLQAQKVSALIKEGNEVQVTSAKAAGSGISVYIGPRNNVRPHLCWETVSANSWRPPSPEQ